MKTTQNEIQIQKQIKKTNNKFDIKTVVFLLFYAFRPVFHSKMFHDSYRFIAAIVCFSLICFILFNLFKSAFTTN